MFFHILLFPITEDPYVIYVDVAEDQIVVYCSLTYLIIFLPMMVHVEITGESCRCPKDPMRWGDTGIWASWHSAVQGCFMSVKYHKCDDGRM